jgi:pantoate--beta-alanine ligase
MIIFHRSKDIQSYLHKKRKKGISIGFVPTMGALHKGHINLVQQAIEKNELAVCSIFINPTQFNNQSDFEKYPHTIQADIEQLQKAGCQVLFSPSIEEIYPIGTNVLKQYELGFLETVLEGKFRPGHFQGVCQVMDRLLSIISPTDLFMGSKDYQQCMVVQKLIELNGWQQQIQFHACHTFREEDGLAMSSRNLRLNKEQRSKAILLFKILEHLKKEIVPGSLSSIKQKAISLLTDHGFKVDYVEIADAKTLSLVTEWDGKQQLIALIAAFIGEVRLIDNMILTD